jgi:hypothetical protein
MRQVSVIVAILAAAQSADANKPRIVVELPENRAKCGRLILLDSVGRRAAGPFAACGVADAKAAKAHNNKGRSTLLSYGDTPTGGYRVTGIFKVGTDSYKAKSYGNYAAIRLEPTSGEAKLAKDNGRTGLLIHGGDLGPNNRLRPTNGCIRVSNDDIKKLIEEIIVLATKEAPPDACSAAVTPDVEVVEPAAATGYDEGDPPPTGAEASVLP